MCMTCMMSQLRADLGEHFVERFRAYFEKLTPVPDPSGQMMVLDIVASHEPKCATLQPRKDDWFAGTQRHCDCEPSFHTSTGTGSELVH